MAGQIFSAGTTGPHAVWDGGTHAFILDTVVHPDFQHLGIGRDLVRTVTAEAFKAGRDWVHVD
jgi:ribosomal protein S18 acetylase RimI-like enzyme